MLLLTLGLLVGCVITLVVDKIMDMKQNITREDEYERVLQEWKASFRALEEKQTELASQVEQMRSILREKSTSRSGSRKSPSKNT